MGRGGSLPTNPHGGSVNQQRLSQSSQAGATAASLLALNKPPAAFASLAGLLAQNQGSDASPNLSLKSIPQQARHSPKQDPISRAKIVDPLQVYDNINLGRRIDPLWPDETWRAQGGRNNWKNWIPEEDMEGEVVHTWTPCHREALRRSHVDKTIVLLKLGERYVPIVESAIKYVDNNAASTEGKKKISRENVAEEEEEGREGEEAANKIHSEAKKAENTSAGLDQM